MAVGYSPAGTSGPHGEMPEDSSRSSGTSQPDRPMGYLEKKFAKTMLPAPKIELIEVTSPTSVQVFWTLPRDYNKYEITDFRIKYSYKKKKEQGDIPFRQLREYYAADIKGLQSDTWYTFKVQVLLKTKDNLFLPLKKGAYETYKSPNSERYFVQVENLESYKHSYSTGFQYLSRWKIIQDVLNLIHEGNQGNKKRSIFRGLFEPKIPAPCSSYLIGNDAEPPTSMVPIWLCENQRQAIGNDDPVWALMLERLSFFDRLPKNPESHMVEGENPALYKVPMTYSLGGEKLPYLSALGRSIFLLPEDYTFYGVCDQPYRQMFFEWLKMRNKLSTPGFPPSFNQSGYYDNENNLLWFPNDWFFQGYDFQQRVWDLEDDRVSPQIHLILKTGGLNGVYLGMVPKWWVCLPNGIRAEFHEAVESKLVLKNREDWDNVHFGESSIISEDEWSPLPPGEDPFPSVGNLDSTACFWRTREAQKRAQRYDRRCLPGACQVGTGNDLQCAGSNSLRIGNDPMLTGSNSLRTGNDSMFTGSNQLETGNDPLFTGSNQLRTGNNPLFAEVNSLRTENDLMFIGPNPLRTGNDLQFAGSNPLRTGNDPMITVSNQLRTGNDPLFADLNSLRTGNDPLFAGSNPLRTGNDPLFAGSNPLRTVNDPLFAGPNPLQTGNDPLFAEANPQRPEHDDLSNWQLMEAALELNSDTSRPGSSALASTATSDFVEDLIFLD